MRPFFISNYWGIIMKFLISEKDLLSINESICYAREYSRDISVLEALTNIENIIDKGLENIDDECPIYTSPFGKAADQLKVIETLLVKGTHDEIKKLMLDKPTIRDINNFACKNINVQTQLVKFFKEEAERNKSEFLCGKEIRAILAKVGGDL